MVFSRVVKGGGMQKFEDEGPVQNTEANFYKGNRQEKSERVVSFLSFLSLLFLLSLSSTPEIRVNI